MTNNEWHDVARIWNNSGKLVYETRDTKNFYKLSIALEQTEAAVLRDFLMGALDGNSTLPHLAGPMQRKIAGYQNVLNVLAASKELHHAFKLIVRPL